MIMSDNLHTVRAIDRPMTMVKMESLRLPRIHSINNVTDFVIMVAGD